MKTVHRYIASHVIRMILSVSLVLLAIEFFILVINEYSHIGKGDYSLLPAMLFIVLRLPTEFYELFPIVALLGSLLSLSALANQSELVVLRASSYSMTNMFQSLLFCALLVNLVAVGIGELLAPMALRVAYNKKALETSHGQAFRSQQGLWLREQQRFIHIQRIHEPNTLLGIEQFRFNPQGALVDSLSAKQARYRDQQWALFDVKQTQYRDTITTTHVKEKQWPIALQPEFLQTLSVSDRELPLWELYQQLSSQQPAAASLFWQRIVKPLLIALMMCLAVPFVFNAHYRHSMGARILLGLGIGFIYYFSQRMLTPISVVFQWPGWLTAVLPLMCCALALGLNRTKTA